VLRILLSIWRLVLPFLLLMAGWGVLVNELLDRVGLSRPFLNTPERTILVGTLLVGLFFIGVITPSDCP